MNKVYLFSTVFFITFTSNPTIKILCTAALIPQDYESRKNQYIRSLTTLRQYGYDPYVVESCQTGPTFLDSYCKHVCYTQTNNPSFSKSYNEGISMLVGLKYFNFDPEDIIIKLTGRYTLEKNEFITLVEQNPDVDAVVRSMCESDAYTGLFALRMKYFLDMLELFVNKESNQQHFCIEWAVGLYVTQMKKNGAKIIYLEKVYDYLPICTNFRYRFFNF